MKSYSNKQTKLEERAQRKAQEPENQEGEEEAEDDEEEEDKNSEDDGSDTGGITSDESEEDDYIDELPDKIVPPPKFRKSVSAEAFGMYNKKGYFNVRTVSKDDETKEKIKERVSHSFMFK
jgi:hypothetical protein